MQYSEWMSDLLEALKDQDLDSIEDCAEVLYNLAHNLIPVTDRESRFAGVLSEKLEELAF